MSYKAITIYTPPGSEPHITAEDDAFIYDAVFDGTSGILGALECVKVSDNTVRLSGGGVLNRGYAMYIPGGCTHELVIANGSQELGRHDLVVSRFTRGGGDVPDTHEFAVVKGTPALSPTDPALSQEEPVTYGDVSEVALFRVTLNGLAVVSVERLAPVLGDNGESVTAERLKTARALSLGGDLHGTAVFDGSADTVISARVKRINGTKITISSEEPANPSEGDLWLHYGG